MAVAKGFWRMGEAGGVKFNQDKHGVILYCRKCGSRLKLVKDNATFNQRSGEKYMTGSYKCPNYSEPKWWEPAIHDYEIV